MVYSGRILPGFYPGLWSKNSIDKKEQMFSLAPILFQDVYVIIFNNRSTSVYQQDKLELTEQSGGIKYELEWNKLPNMVKQ